MSYNYKNVTCVTPHPYIKGVQVATRRVETDRACDNCKYPLDDHQGSCTKCLEHKEIRYCFQRFFEPGCSTDVFHRGMPSCTPLACCFAHSACDYEQLHLNVHLFADIDAQFPCYLLDTQMGVTECTAENIIYRVLCGMSMRSIFKIDLDMSTWMQSNTKYPIVSSLVESDVFQQALKTPSKTLCCFFQDMVAIGNIAGGALVTDYIQDFPYPGVSMEQLLSHDFSMAALLPTSLFRLVDDRNRKDSLWVLSPKSLITSSLPPLFKAVDRIFTLHMITTNELDARLSSPIKVSARKPKLAVPAPISKTKRSSPIPMPESMPAVPVPMEDLFPSSPSSPSSPMLHCDEVLADAMDLGDEEDDEEEVQPYHPKVGEKQPMALKHVFEALYNSEEEEEEEDELVMEGPAHLEEEAAAVISSMKQQKKRSRTVLVQLPHVKWLTDIGFPDPESVSSKHMFPRYFVNKENQHCVLYPIFGSLKGLKKAVAVVAESKGETPIAVIGEKTPSKYLGRISPYLDTAPKHAFIFERYASEEEMMSSFHMYMQLSLLPATQISGKNKSDLCNEWLRYKILDTSGREYVPPAKYAKASIMLESEHFAQQPAERKTMAGEDRFMQNLLDAPTAKPAVAQIRKKRSKVTVGSDDDEDFSPAAAAADE